MNLSETQVQSTSKAAIGPNTKRVPGYFLYRKCMYCQTVYGRTPCEEEMHGKFSHGICPHCAICGPFVPLMPIDEGRA